MHKKPPLQKWQAFSALYYCPQDSPLHEEVRGLFEWRLSSDAIFLFIFRPFLTQLHFTFLTPHLSPLCLFQLCSFSSMKIMPSRSRTNNKEHNLIGTTRHRTTRLLGHRHSETILLSLFTWILCGNLYCRHRTLPPLKVPDFPNSEHE